MDVKTDDHPIDLRNLSPTGHLVLGMVALFGPMTSYQLEQRVASTVASFWLFPHSQLYAEPRKLSDAGLLRETVEEGGRKRRTYEMTNAGHAALEVWFSEPESGRSEARDPGSAEAVLRRSRRRRRRQAAGREPGQNPPRPRA